MNPTGGLEPLQSMQHAGGQLQIPSSWVVVYHGQSVCPPDLIATPRPLARLLRPERWGHEALHCRQGFFAPAHHRCSQRRLYIPQKWCASRGNRSSCATLSEERTLRRKGLLDVERFCARDHHQQQEQRRPHLEDAVSVTVTLVSPKLTKPGY